MGNKETWSQMNRRCNEGDYRVGDLVSQDNKRDFGFYHKVNIEPETVLSLIGAKAMKGLMAAPKIIQIIFANSECQEGVQIKEGVWSLWVRRMPKLENEDGLFFDGRVL